MTRVFLIENHLLMREVTRDLIEREADLTVCGEASTAAAAIERVAEAAPDLVLVDLALPDASGIELVSTLRARHPQLRVAVLSGNDEPRSLEDALAAGVDGYILKGTAEELPDAIRRIARDERYVSPGMQRS